MLDHIIRPIINPPLEKTANYLSQYNFTANHITIFGFICGLIAMAYIYFIYYITACIFLLINRLCDGLDGPLSRINNKNNKRDNNDFGGFLDIICDFIIYSGIVFAFGLSDYAENNIYYASFLIYSFMGTACSFLAYAIVAAKHGLSTDMRGKKSFYHHGGLCEGTETFIVLCLICLLPAYFNQICLIYGILCWVTTGHRVYCGYVDLNKPIY